MADEVKHRPETPVFVTRDTVDIGPEDKRVPRGLAALLAPGTAVGRYLILERLGEGGMGVVYAAYDPQLGRKVAIKLLTPPRMRDGAQQARLLREAQALAQLSHPNVVAIHDVGAYEERVFIAMDLVDGRNVRQWLAAEPRPWREVLHVFREAARGIVAAHQRGLVHRDLKPDNFLIARDGRVYVSDFGAARQAKDSEPEAPVAGEVAMHPSALSTPLTQAGRVIGTPRYMPPEAFSDGAVDQAGDQFSFCVALYEALFDARPFDGDSDGPERWRVREPPRRSPVPPWLRRVVLRGLQESPAERHPSMAVLLAALEHDPAVKRRRVIAAVAAVAAIAVGAGVVQRAASARAHLCQGAGGELAGVWDASVKQRLRAEFIISGAPDAPDTWTRVERTVDDYTRDWVAMRGAACSATRIAGVQSDADLSLRMACLDRRLSGVKAFVDVFSRPDAATLERVVKAAHGLPPISGCADLAALRLPMPPPEDPLTRAKVDALRGQLQKSEALSSAGKFVAAADLARDAVAAAVPLHYRPLDAELLYRLARAETDLGRAAEAEKTYQRALSAAVAGGHEELAGTTAALLAGLVGYDLGRRDWEPWVELSRAHIERLGGSPKIEAQLENEIGLCFGLSDLDEARRHLERALALREKTLGRDTPAVAMAHNNLGSNALQRGDYDMAARELGQSIEIYERVLGPHHPDLAYAVSNLGDTLLERGRYDEARPYFERVRAILGPSSAHPTLWAENEQSLCEIELAEGHDATVLECLRPVRDAIERSVGLDHPHYGANLSELEGEALSHLGRHAEAIAAKRRALALRQKGYSGRSAIVAAATASLASTLLAAGERPESLRLFKEALDIYDKDADKSGADALEGLGRWYLEGHQPAEALTWLERALEVRLGKRAQPPPEIARALTDVGRAQLALGRVADAVTTLRRALATGAPATLPGPVLADARLTLAQALWPDVAARAEARKLALAARDQESTRTDPRRAAPIAAWLAAHR